MSSVSSNDDDERFLNDRNWRRKNPIVKHQHTKKDGTVSVCFQNFNVDYIYILSSSFIRLRIEETEIFTGAVPTAQASVPCHYFWAALFRGSGFFMVCLSIDI